LTVGLQERVGSRIGSAEIWRCAGWILFFSCWAGAASPVLADNPDSPANAASTNSAASTFIETHPELAQPAPAEPPGLSLRPGQTPAPAPPEVTQPGSDIFPDITPQANPMTEAENLADHLLVVYNANDPDSKGLAEYYASQRLIPEERVLAISCPLAEEITRAQFDDTIRAPIVSYLCQKNWMFRVPEMTRIGNRSLDLLVAVRNDIWAIVLIRGVPLKIAPDPSKEDSMEPQPIFETNAAAVDSELALLPVFGLPEGGYVPSVFFDNQVQGIKRVGAELARNMILVTRLDGPQPSDVRRMIDDTIYAEKNRLAGEAVIDTRGITDNSNAYMVGDVWLRKSRDLLAQDGWAVKFDDNPDVLPPTDPCNQVALYLGWYTQTATGPWITPPNRFVRGAIAYHLHSYSATTVRSTQGAWVGPLISHGVAATMGTVYEPYLILTPHEDIFTRRLLQGDYFAEAAYAAEPALSWMMTVVGDPLYRPFHTPLDTALAQSSSPHSPHDDWLLLQKVQRQLAAVRILATADSLKDALEVPGAGPFAEEGLGDLLVKLKEPAAGPAAEQAYMKAAAEETEPIDRIRVGLKLADYENSHGENLRASAELDSLRVQYPQDAKQFGISDSSTPSALVPVNSADGHPPSPPSSKRP
jgi:uncharacterized protein (TIGR03790 family)